MKLLYFFALVFFVAPANGQEQTPPAEFIAQGARVVMFSPTKAERDSIARAEGLEIDDVLDDFNFFSGKAAAYLSRRHIPADFTSSPIIVVKLAGGKVRRFDRRLEPGLVGMLLTDGVREPLIVPGSETEQELIAQINQFFRLKQE